MSDEPWWTQVVFPALLRHARTTYGEAMRKALATIDCEDVPRNGLYVIGALSREQMPLSQVIRDLGVSKQAAGQLVDTLVLRGYLERRVDPEDRRRLTVTLTDRGRAAAAAQAVAGAAVDAELLARVGEEKLLHAREVLGALIAIGAERRDSEG